MTISTPNWVPDGPLGDRVTAEVAEGLMALARSTDPNDTDLLMLIGMTQGLRHPRFAVEAIAVERDLTQARDSLRLERVLILISVLAFLAAAAQVVTAIIK